MEAHDAAQQENELAALNASAVSGLSPPAGPEFRRGAMPLVRAPMTFDKSLCAALDGFTLRAATRDGAQPLIAQSGWSSSFNASLPANSTALIAALSCHATYQTWTNGLGTNETRAMNCLQPGTRGRDIEPRNRRSRVPTVFLKVEGNTGAMTSR